MKTRVRELVEQGDKLFSQRSGMLSLWQTMAENFYPMRADFTTNLNGSEEFAAHLTTGRPVLAHRDLGNSLSSMLRPRGQPWFHARTNDERINHDAAARQFLDAQSDVMRRMMYDQHSQFIRATKEGDADFVCFGQAVLEVTPNRDLSGPLYRCWHLRDTAWCENEELRIDTVQRNWSVEVRVLDRLFPGKLAAALKETLKKEPYKKVKCRHIVMPAEAYDLSNDGEGRKVNRARFPFVSIYVDTENDVILEEVPRKRLGYIIPRWVTVSGSQYAHSPATVTALPDARMLQQMTLTILESGQKAVDPPLKATKEAIVGSVNVYAGGITWVDSAYDERDGAALETLMDAPPGLNWGDRREEKIEAMISDAFYLNKIALPDLSDGKMTAYEVRKRIEEYIRSALPLFEPMEVEYNGGLCEETWEIGMDLGAFGSMEDMPPILDGGRDIVWQFESPLQAANERAKSQAFVESMNLLSMAAQADPTVRHDFNLDKAFRDAMGSAPAEWLVPNEQAQQAKVKERNMLAMQQQIEQTIGTVGAGADAAKTAGEAGQAIIGAGHSGRELMGAA